MLNNDSRFNTRENGNMSLSDSVQMEGGQESQFKSYRARSARNSRANSARYSSKDVDPRSSKKDIP